MKGLRILAMCLLFGLVVAGCSAGTPTAASPARLAPANSMLYLELTVRPQGNQQAAVESAVTRLLGHSPDRAIQRLVTRLFHSSGITYGDLQPWLGQRIAIVLTAFSRNGLGLIAPTGDPSAARATLSRGEKTSQVTPATYRGVHYQRGTDHGQPVAYGLVGRNAVVAAPRVFTAIVDAYRGRSLTGNGAFRSALSTAPSSSLIKGYVNLSAIGSLIGQRVLKRIRSGAIPSSLAHKLAPLLAKLRGPLGFSLAVTRRAFTFDVHAPSTPYGGGGDVSGLPEQSWLALATSGFNTTRIAGLLKAVRNTPQVSAFLARFKAHTGLDLIHQLLPALGPLKLSAEGTSLLDLGAGLVIIPSHLAAARQVLAGLRRLAARSSGLTVQGSNRSFSITKAGLPIPRVLVAEVGHRIVATVDEAFAALLSPSSTLSSNPQFKVARSQFHAGSRVSFFLDFRAVGQLLEQIPSFKTNPADHQLLRVIGRLNYLVLGSSPAQHDTRLVLALR